MAINGRTTQMFAALEDIRKQRDWTFLQLAEEIERVTHRHRDEDCWRRICLGITTKPNERTIDILETFLDYIRPTVKRRSRRVS